MPFELFASDAVQLLRTHFSDGTTELLARLRTINDARALNDAFAATKTFYEQMARDKRRFYTVIDLRELRDQLPIDSLKTAVQFFKSVTQGVQEHYLCTILIFESLIVQSAVKFVLSWYTPFRPIHSVQHDGEIAATLSAYRGAASARSTA